MTDVPDRSPGPVGEVSLAALLDAGRTALGAGDPARAEVAFRRAVSAAPDLDAAWHQLGRARQRQVGLAAAAREIALAADGVPAAAPARLAARMLAQSGQRTAAVDRARLAVGRDPDGPASIALLASLLRDTGATAEARALVEAALARHPDDVLLRVEAAAILLDARVPEAAADHATRALATDGGNVRALALQVRALGRIADLSAREAAVRRWLAADPDADAAIYELARVLAAQQRITEAAPLVPKILRARPDDGLAYMFCAMLVSSLGRHRRARPLAERAVALAPHSSQAQCALATILNRLGSYAEAELAAREALRLSPGMVEAHTALTLSLQRQGRMAEAVEAGERAFALDPNDPDVVAQIATLQWALGNHDAALANFAKGLALRPDDAEMHFNRALVHFACGDLARGWADFSWRWAMRSAMRRPFPQPWWDGKPTDRHLLVWGEQGIGDEVLAVGVVAEARARVGGMVLECDRRLVPLFRRSFPGIDVVARADPSDPAAVAPEVALQCPVVNLPMFLRRRWRDFRPHTGYLVPDPVRVAELRARYRAGRSGPVVGISWHSTNPRHGERKSMALADWAEILRIPGVTFLDLQYGEWSADLAAVRTATGADLIHDEAVDPMADLDGFAAQVAAADLVITVSNSTAHFAGATGRPTWLLLPRGNAVLWYWLLSRNGRVPWYPSMRVFQQDAIGDWESVLGRIATLLRERAMQDGA